MWQVNEEMWLRYMLILVNVSNQNWMEVYSITIYMEHLRLSTKNSDLAAVTHSGGTSPKGCFCC